MQQRLRLEVHHFRIFGGIRDPEHELPAVLSARVEVLVALAVELASFGLHVEGLPGGSCGIRIGEARRLRLEDAERTGGFGRCHAGV